MLRPQHVSEPLSGKDSRPLWNAATRAFDGARLRGAMVSRGWTASEFATATALTPASIYSALRGHPVRDRTALKILQALSRREAIRVAE
jgi:predicted transcriptional regulator